jgi:hypothetical protein
MQDGLALRAGQPGGYGDDGAAHRGAAGDGVALAGDHAGGGVVPKWSDDIADKRPTAQPEKSGFRVFGKGSPRGSVSSTFAKMALTIVEAPQKRCPPWG